ncbi:MAG: S41 family peptidase [Victivallales bacterium]|nr:S41 family peptidase [Victivallales bacterium]
MFIGKYISILLAAFILFSLPLAGEEKLEKLDLTAVEESPALSDETEAYDHLRRLVAVMKLLQQLYVDPDRVSMKKLVDGALKGMLHELDPYSSYETLQEENDLQPASHLGIGIMGVKSKRSGLKVIYTLKDSPAAESGLKVGDLIIRIDNQPTGGLTFQQCGKLLKGPVGTVVRLEVLREGLNNPLVFNIKRAVFAEKEAAVKNFRVLDNGIAYIRLDKFDNNSIAFLDKALKELVDKDKCQGLILDLRNNPGGIVEAAIALCGRFLETGQLIITIEGRDLKKAQKIYAAECKKYPDIPLVVMINDFSASASEIVAGCLKDHNRAILLGSKTFGKGSVQRVCKIKDNGTLRFTVAMYFTPAHNIIHGKGIEPHIKVPMSLKQRLKLAQQLVNSPGVIEPSAPGMVRDVQLLRAEQVMTGILKFREKNNAD